MIECGVCTSALVCCCFMVSIILFTSLPAPIPSRVPHSAVFSFFSIHRPSKPLFSLCSTTATMQSICFYIYTPPPPPQPLPPTHPPTHSIRLLLVRHGRGLPHLQLRALQGDVPARLCQRRHRHGGDAVPVQHPGAGGGRAQPPLPAAEGGWGEWSGWGQGGGMRRWGGWA